VKIIEVGNVLADRIETGIDPADIILCRCLLTSRPHAIEAALNTARLRLNSLIAAIGNCRQLFKRHALRF